MSSTQERTIIGKTGQINGIDRKALDMAECMVPGGKMTMKFSNAGGDPNCTYTATCRESDGLIEVTLTKDDKPLLKSLYNNETDENVTLALNGAQ